MSPDLPTTAVTASAVTAGLPPALAWPLALVALLAWVVTHRLRSAPTAGWAVGAQLAGRSLLGAVGLWALLEGLRPVVAFTAAWPLWLPTAGGALSAELVIVAYSLERRLVAPRTGRLLLALRLTVVLLLALLLTQPVVTLRSVRRVRRAVAVLLDTSTSMQVPDTQLTPPERVRLAELMPGAPPARAVRLEAVGHRLLRLRNRVAACADWLRGEAPPPAAASADDGLDSALRQALEAASKELGAVAAELGQAATAAGLDQPARDWARALESRLGQEVVAAIDRARALTPGKQGAGGTDTTETILQELTRAGEALARLEGETLALADAADQRDYLARPAAARAAVDAVAAQPREALALRVLDGGLLGKLAADYTVKLYHFAAKPTEVAAAGPQAGAPAAPATAPDPTSGSARQTDLSAAVDRALADIPADRLAGLVLLTDGRHNGPGDVDLSARQCALLGVPVTSVVFGGAATPTCDAAVVAVEAPEAVMARDAVAIRTELKLDGLAGRTVKVVLYNGDQAVDSRDVQVTGDQFRHQVQFAHTPETAGLQPYRISIEGQDGEVLADNNVRPVPVSVSAEPTRLLLVESRPRWEFRYLKNLFMGRDRTVRLQYVVLHPDRVAGAPAPAVVAAAAGRDQPEATALPATAEEWTAFDVIVLGDLGPDVLTPEIQRILSDFVTRRGGTLVLIAGPGAMPHAVATGPLADVLPVTVTPPPPGRPGWLASADDEPFRIVLTPEGRDHIVTRLRPSPADNAAVWAELPELPWRHPLLTARDTATVLAFAVPGSAPDYLRPGAGQDVPDADTLRRQQEYSRSHPLVTYQEVGFGRVMLLAFDSVWRFRYRQGDTYHHRFWGQVLRWATADKLPDGSSTVRLGADRPRFPATAEARIRARLNRPDFTPVRDDNVNVNVYLGSRQVLRRRMEYVEGSPGLYTASLGVLPPGTYRAELDAPAVRDVLAGQGVARVETSFCVETVVPVELTELAADRGLLERLAAATGGVVTEPTEAQAVLAALRPGQAVTPRVRQWAVWDSWPLLLALLAAASTEWWLRKRVRLP